MHTRDCTEKRLMVMLPLKGAIAFLPSSSYSIALHQEFVNVQILEHNCTATTIGMSGSPFPIVLIAAEKYLAAFPSGKVVRKVWK